MSLTSRLQAKDINNVKNSIICEVQMQYRQDESLQARIIRQLNQELNNCKNVNECESIRRQYIR